MDDEGALRDREAEILKVNKLLLTKLKINCKLEKDFQRRSSRNIGKSSHFLTGRGFVLLLYMF